MQPFSRTSALGLLALLAGAPAWSDDASDQEAPKSIQEQLDEANARIERLESLLTDDDAAPTTTDPSSPGALDAGAPPETRPAPVDDEDDGLHFVIPGTEGAEVIFNGRIHLDYWGFPKSNGASDTLEGENPQDRFGFRRIRFGAKGDIVDLMNYKVEMEFADPDDIEWRDVYIGFEELPWLQTLLIGNQKRPYGLDHLNSSRYNVFLERPMFVDAFNDDARRMGIVSYGVSDEQEWNWRYGVYNGDKIQDSDSFYRSDHLQGEVAGRIANTPWYPEESEGRDYFHWALSGTVAFPDGDAMPAMPNTARFRARPEARTNERWVNTDFIAMADTYELVGVESVFNLGSFHVGGEYQSTFTQRGGGSDLHFWGAYGYVSYVLTGEHIPWNRKRGTLGRLRPFRNFFLADRVTGEGETWGCGAWEIAARFSYTDLTSQEIRGGVGQNLTLGLNWYWNPNSRLQFNYIHGWIDESAALEMAGGDHRAEYDIVGARFMVDF